MPRAFLKFKAYNIMFDEIISFHIFIETIVMDSVHGENINVPMSLSNLYGTINVGVSFASRLLVLYFKDEEFVFLCDVLVYSQESKL